ncbi:sorting nexin-9/18/33 [Sarotherodon galilaeus]
MPRKGQRSQSQKLRREKEKEQVNVSQSSEPVKVCVSTFPSTEVQSSVQTATVSYADVVYAGIHIEPQVIVQTHHDGETATVSYADVVKRGVPSVSVPKPEVMQVIHIEPQVTVQTQHDGQAPGPSHVQVTNSESCPRDEFITRADLNRVLDKGHAVYSDARKRFVNSVFLACDELPTVVTSRRHEYQADMSQFAHYGTFDGTDHFQSLEQGLQCLVSDIRYALLVMGGTVIAVCRLTSGEYAYFDPHPRKSTGMPLSLSVSGGTAVMLKFTRLNDMIDRIKRLYRMFSIAPTCTYELQPIEFHSENAADQRDANQTTEYRQTATSAPALNERVHELNSKIYTEQTRKPVTNNLTSEVMSSRADSSNETAAPGTKHHPSDYFEKETSASSVRETPVTPDSVPQNDSNTASSSTKITEELSDKLLKRNNRKGKK